MNETTYYLVRFVFEDRARFTLWCDGGSEGDRFATTADSSNLLVAETSQNLLRIALDQQLVVSGREAQSVDIDAMMHILKRLRPSESTSRHACVILLESWNALEDLARTINAPFAPVDMDAAIAREIARKLFEGNNLPSVSTGKKQSPVFTPIELRLLRLGLRNAAMLAVNQLAFG